MRLCDTALPLVACFFFACASAIRARNELMPYSRLRKGWFERFANCGYPQSLDLHVFATCWHYPPSLLPMVVTWPRKDHAEERRLIESLPLSCCSIENSGSENPSAFINLETKSPAKIGTCSGTMITIFLGTNAFLPRWWLVHARG